MNEWGKGKRKLPIIILVGMWGNINSHSLLVRTQYGTATFRDSLMVSYKTKNILII